ncbi:hypothetical protein EDB83DRAFT_2337912 [Lactarius deliciosus]|nr:hypothetical protein EDB83DRAFT_2337912 [Lactarius deliciosus]
MPYLIVATPCHSSFLVCCCSLSLLSAGNECSFRLCPSNLFSDLLLTPPVFSRIERSHPRSHAFAFFPFLF